MPDRLTTDIIDAELAPGARNAIRVCLRLQPRSASRLSPTRRRPRSRRRCRRKWKKCVPITPFSFWKIHGAPAPIMPKIILDDLARSQVTFFAAQTQTGELGARREMSAVVKQTHPPWPHGQHHSAEHARGHARRLQCDRCAKPATDRSRAHEQTNYLSHAHRTRIRGGTFAQLKWLKTSGIITPEKWGNLPGGEIFTSPKNSNGTFVVDGVVGDYLCQKYGDLRETPVMIRVKKIGSSMWNVHVATCLMSSALTLQPMRIRIGSVSLPLGQTLPALISSGTSCRTRRYPAFTSRSAILMPSTPARNGFQKPTSIASAAISTSFSMTNRSCEIGKFLV